MISDINFLHKKKKKKKWVYGFQRIETTLHFANRTPTQEELSAEFVHVVYGPEVGGQRRYAGEERVEERLLLHRPVGVVAWIRFVAHSIVLNHVTHRGLGRQWNYSNENIKIVATDTLLGKRSLIIKIETRVDTNINIAIFRFNHKSFSWKSLFRI